jgi:hypothetical protein
MKLWELFADKILKDTDLFEMAIQRREGLKNIADLSFDLAEHMVKLEHCQEARCDRHWKVEVNAWLGKMYRQTRIKKKAKLSREALIEAIWEGPLGEYEDYLDRYEAAKEDEKKNLKPGEKELEFSEPSEEAWFRIKVKLLKAIDLMLERKIPKYDIL